MMLAGQQRLTRAGKKRHRIDTARILGLGEHTYNEQCTPMIDSDMPFVAAMAERQRDRFKTERHKLESRLRTEAWTKVGVAALPKRVLRQAHRPPPGGPTCGWGPRAPRPGEAITLGGGRCRRGNPVTREPLLTPPAPSPNRGDRNAPRAGGSDGVSR
jgi:hypothetical protein